MHNSKLAPNYLLACQSDRKKALPSKEKKEERTIGSTFSFRSFLRRKSCMNIFLRRKFFWKHYFWAVTYKKIERSGATLVYGPCLSGDQALTGIFGQAQSFKGKLNRRIFVFLVLPMFLCASENSCVSGAWTRGDFRKVTVAGWLIRDLLHAFRIETELWKLYPVQYLEIIGQAIKVFLLAYSSYWSSQLKICVIERNESPSQPLFGSRARGGGHSL